VQPREFQFKWHPERAGAVLCLVPIVTTTATVAAAAQSTATALSYWRASRAPRYSVLFALPLLLLYEALIALRPARAGGLINGADALLGMAARAVAGVHGPLLFAGLLTGAGVWLVARDLSRTRGSLRPRIFALMFAESLALAILFGGVVGWATAQLLGVLPSFASAASPSLDAVAIASAVTETSMGLRERLSMSLGAGLYEELFFRVILAGALAAGARLLFGWRPLGAGAFAAISSALLFSAFHYVGPFGEPFEVASFTYRAIAGLAFSLLYLTRGFGITAWTHALYDVLVLVVLIR